MDQSLSQPATAGSIAKRIDENALPGQLRNPTQELISKDADIRPDAGEQIRQHDAVENAGWVIGHGNDRAGEWNFAQGRRRNGDLNIELVKQIAHEMLAPGALVEFFQLIDAQEPVHGQCERTRQAVRGKRSKSPLSERLLRVR